MNANMLIVGLALLLQPSVALAVDKHVLTNHSRGLGVLLVVQDTTIKRGDDLNVQVYLTNEGSVPRNVVCRSPQGNERFTIYDPAGAVLQPERTLGETSNNGPRLLQPGERTQCAGATWLKLSRFGYRLKAVGAYKITAIRNDFGDDDTVYGIASNTVQITVVP